MTNGDNTMIYPPIKEVVKKLGDSCSRYDLVIAAAKRARIIAQKDKDDSVDDKNMLKPITRAVREIMDDDFYIVHGDEIDESTPIPDTGSMVIDLNSEENNEEEKEDDTEESAEITDCESDDTSEISVDFNIETISEDSEEEN